ncbi:MAG: NYN domain-containing protein [Clostridia bacterium]|nr:NYN domain-containing protein [Clostridia bacterium]
MKTLVLIDGDNIDESYVPAVCKETGAYLDEGEFYEIHCFSDFVKRKQSWKDAYFIYGVQLHYIPGMEKQKGKPDPNTSDIALTGFAVKKLYEVPELENVIIVANDKDYAPLAKIIMEEHQKNAIMFYTQSNDTAANYYSKSILLNGTEKTEEVSKQEEAVSDSGSSEFRTFITLTNCIEDLFNKNPQRVLLAELGPALKEKGLKYGKSVGKFLTEMFERYPVLNDEYVLRLSDKKDRIERVAD